MIQEISADDFHEIEDIVEEYASIGEGIFAPETPLKDRLRKSLSEETIGVYAAFEKDHVIGFSVIGVKNGGISILHINESAANPLQVRKDLFDAGFEKLSAEFPIVRIGSRSVPEDLSEYVISKGFVRYDRKHMTLSRQKITSLSQRDIDDDYNFEIYTSDMKDEVAKLIYEANIDNIDVNVFPNFFSTIESVNSLIANIENDVYGKYLQGYSFVLQKGDIPVGVIFLTKTDDETGYIPDICIHKNERRRGLARAIQIYGFKKMIEGDAKILRINLDVTMDNPARHLYESLGFEDVGKYAVYMWNNSS